MNREVDLERKNSKGLKEKLKITTKELEEVKKKIEGDNHPDLLRVKVNELTSKIAAAKKENNLKTKEITLLVGKVEKSQMSLDQVAEYINSELHSMVTWIGSCMSSKYVFSTAIEIEKKEYKLPR